VLFPQLIDLFDPVAIPLLKPLEALRELVRQPEHGCI
jgi:hypothetical protein